MKITLVDHKTGNLIRIYHDPQEVVEKPKAGILQVKANGNFDNYRLLSSKIVHVTDRDLDIKEYHFNYLVGDKIEN